MFTGLIEELGIVKAIQSGAKSIQLTITAKKVLEDVKIGDSIAVNGTCLTVVRYNQHDFTADVMPETVKRTVLSQLKIGDVVNLERTLALGDRFGGHIVSGHIDGIGTILSMTKDDNAIVVKIKVADHLLRYIIEKGSVAIDGISLTVVEVADSYFSVSLIPHSAQMTTLGKKAVGDIVNIENDIIGKYVERLLNLSVKEEKKTSISMDFLRENGF
ncbi:riboflavin synthase [Anaerosinus gibii]|uniref:Riboflavin synthase n=1 Tax=Selenobaculum gibii TaxID=3054208 RepID=A0A9Y2AL35_9FIRM|nr:riboflavin synthase [Selenobaculum gbiensis]WIW71848.1 riboflavin synthase [Selenobaculum gbiensis]